MLPQPPTSPTTNHLGIASHDHGNRSSDWFAVHARVEEEEGEEEGWGRGKAKEDERWEDAGEASRHHGKPHQAHIHHPSLAKRTVHVT
jgi:hypothetical protein